MKYDVIIIGSGLGGLECGYILAKKGMSVLVLERQAQPGGCLQSYRRRGVAFDTGMHYCGGLGEGQSLYAPFKYLGLLDLPWQHLDADGFDYVTIGERSYKFAEGHDAFFETLVKDFPHQASQLKAYTNKLKEVGEHIYDAFNPRNEVDFYTTSLFSVGAHNYLTETFTDNTLINVLSGTSIKMELNKETLPLYTFAQPNNSFIQSSWRLKGDGNLIVNHLVDGIRTMGGEVICNCEVEELIEEEGILASARCSNGETYEAKTFISNVHPAVTSELVKESAKIKKVYRHRLQGLENSFGMFTLSLQMKPNSLEYFNHNHYIYTNNNVWDFYKNPDRVEGVMISCRYPETSCSERKYLEVLDIMTPMTWNQVEKWENTSVGHRGEEYNDFKAKKAEECIALAERVLPRLSSMIAQQYTSTPLTYRDYNFTPCGSAYGVRKDFNNPMQTILSPKTPIPNLFLTGQNLTLHGLLGVSMTALFTVSEIIGKEEVRKILQS